METPGMERRSDTSEDELIPGLPPALTDYTGYLLRRAFVRARTCGVGVMPPGRDAKELGLLVVVEKSGPLSQRQLGEVLTVNRSVMVKLVDRLEADGLLQRERDPDDRRSYALRVTEHGKAAISEMTRGAVRGDAEFTSVLSGAERRRLAELLSRIVPDIVRQVPEELSGLVGFLVPRAHLRVRAMAAGPLGELGVAPQHAGILTALAGIEPCSQQRLASELGISGAALIGSLDELQRRVLISRQRNPDDRREQLLRLTPEGDVMRSAARSILDTVHEELAANVGVQELDELNELLLKVAS